MTESRTYYLSSFVWTTISKILNVVLSIVSIPILLSVYGMSDYGVLSIAVACNAYMYVLDLGMNVGAIKFYSSWRAEGNIDKIDRVARTNITFYFIISVINILLLIALALWGIDCFAITDEQSGFLLNCLMIMAGLSLLNWLGSVFYQLLVAYEQIVYAMQVQCVQTLLKLLLVGTLFWSQLSLAAYFFVFSFIISLAAVPYALRCKREQLLRSFKPAFYFIELKEVVLYSLSIFVLSLLQITSVQSRPLLLGIFAFDGASTVAEYRIIELIPNFLIVLSGMFLSIFLPKTSAMMSASNKVVIQKFANVWTLRVSVLANLLGVPFVLCASEVLYIYLGSGYGDLSFWLSLWLPAIVLQLHATPGHAILLAKGKLRNPVVVTFVACILSILVNVLLIPYLGVGAAVVSYYVYILIIISQNYLYYYRKVLHLQSWTMFKCFVQPTALAVLTSVVSYELFVAVSPLYEGLDRVSTVGVVLVKAAIWSGIYLLCLRLSGIQGLTYRKLLMIDTK